MQNFTIAIITKYLKASLAAQVVAIAIALHIYTSNQTLCTCLWMFVKDIGKTMTKINHACTKLPNHHQWEVLAIDGGLTCRSPSPCSLLLQSMVEQTEGANTKNIWLFESLINPSLG